MDRTVAATGRWGISVRGRAVSAGQLHPGARWNWKILGALLSWSLFFPFISAAEPPIAGENVLYSLPAGDAVVTLREFSRQAGIQLVYPISAVRGVQTHAVEGRYTIPDALDQLLAGTPLEAVRDAHTGAWAVRRKVPPASSPQKRERPQPAPMADSREEPVEMDAFAVHNRRDAGLQTQTIFRTDAEAPIYHQVITRKQIEMLGVTSVAELMTMVSGYSGEGMENLQSSVNLSFEGTGTVIYSGAFLKLRGFDSTRSAVLLNGRRLPINVDSRGPDLSRIPLAAVQRVNVLPFSSSALYGDNVIGGAVDIVLRKDYVGRSLSFLYGTTTRGGGDESALTAVEGMTLGNGRTRATFIFDYQHRSALRMSDRDFLLTRAEANRPLEDVWAQVRVSRNTMTTDDSRYFLTASPSYPAVVMPDGGGSGLGIPGEETRFFAVVPRGQDGTKLTPTDFRSSPRVESLERRNQRAILRRPNESFSFTAQIEHAVVPEKWELYAEIGYSRAIDRFSSADLVSELRLSAIDQHNPFGYAANPQSNGWGITVFFDPVDLPDNNYNQVRSGTRLVVGMKGFLNEDWHWTVDTSFDHTDTHTTISSPNRPLNSLMSAIIARPFQFSYLLDLIYNPLADHRAFPISAETMERFFRYRSVMVSDADVYGINARIYGTPIQLPAGPLTVSLRGEYRKEVNHSKNRTDSSAELDALLGSPSTSSRSASSDHFDSLSLTGEMVVPLVSHDRRALLLDTAELNGATRISRTLDGRAKFTQTLALKLSPAPWLGFRGCYSEGYMPPPVSARRAPPVTVNNLGGLVDPAFIGKTPPLFSVIQGGNPTLRAETSVAKVAGILLRPRFAAGLSLTVDYWSIEGKNGIRLLLPQEILDHPNLFPDRITQTLDLSERVRVTIDDRPINLATESSSGIDLTLNGRCDLRRYGGLEFSGTATRVQSHREQVFVSEPPVDLLSRVGGTYRTWSAASPQLPLRGRATLAWEKENLRIGLTANYASPYVGQTVKRVPGLPTTLKNNQDFETVSSSTIWDLQLNYVTPHTRWIRARTTWTLGVRNLFDRAPAYRYDGVAFYSHFEDPRMRFIYLRVQQEW